MELNMRIIGVIGNDATVKHFQNGTAVINFSVVHSEKYLDKNNQKVEVAHWVNCALWRKSDNLKVLPYLTKGILVSCVGMPSARAWKRSDSDEPGYALEMRVEKFNLLSFSKTNAQAVVTASVSVNNAPGPATEIAANDSSILTSPDVISGPNEDLPF